MVFLNHHAPYVPALHHPVLQALISQLFVGVVFFFVLSGFLIADRYYTVDRAQYCGYITRRFFRIFPLYALITVITFIVFAVLRDVPKQALLLEFVANITFLRGWFEELWVTGVAQGWSLTVEMTFYALAPFLFACIRWRWWMLVLLPLGFLSLGVLLVVLCQGKAYLGFMDSFTFLFGITFFGRCLEFFVGIAVALFLRSYGPNSMRFATLAGGLLCMTSIGTAAYLGVDYDDVFGVLLHNVLLPISVGVFFWGLLTEQTLIRRLLSSTLVVFMGRTSYAFYLIHMGVVFTAAYTLTQDLLLTFIVLQGAAWLLYRTVEEPLAGLAQWRWNKAR